MQIKIKKLHPDAIMPQYATDGAACFDLHALAVNGSYQIGTLADEYVPIMVRTGLAFEIPAGHVMLVYSRSGHGFKHDTRLANCVGVIDSDYRGELMVKLTTDRECDEPLPPLKISPGDRVAQAMIVPIPRVELVAVNELGETARGAGGFGSTGA